MISTFLEQHGFKVSTMGILLLLATSATGLPRISDWGILEDFKKAVSKTEVG